MLLIDADMRKPAMHQMFQVDNIFGLTNVLTHSERLEKCVQTTSVEDLNFWHVVQSHQIQQNY